MSHNHHSVDQHYWKKIIVILCLGWTVIWIYRTIMSPIFPEIQGTIGQHTDVEMGLIASFYFFAYTGMQIPAGILVDKFGKKVVLIPGFILFVIATLLIGNATSIGMIYAGSLIAGLGCGSYFGSAYSLSSEHIPQKSRGLSTAIINSGSAVGMGIGLIASSFLVKSLHLPWEYMFYGISFLLVLMVFSFSLVIKNKKNEKVVIDKNKSKNPSINEESTTDESFSPFSLKMIAAYFMYFATCYAYYMIVTWLPSFLQLERGFQGAAIGFAAALVAFSSIPGALLFSRLSDKFSNKKVALIIFLQISSAITISLTAMSPNTFILLTSLILYGFLGKLAIDPIIISYVADNSPKHRYGISFGIFNFFGMSSSVVAPIVTGLISDSTGSKIIAFYLSAVILLIGTVLFFYANFRNQQAHEAVLSR